MLSSQLVQRIGADSPDVHVRFVELPGDLEKLMADGSVDLAVVHQSMDWKLITASPVSRDHFVGLVDAQHPLAGRKRVGDAEIARYRRVEWEPAIHLEARTKPAILQAYTPVGATIYLQSYGAVPLVLMGSDMVTSTIPRVLAHRLVSQLPLRYFELTRNHKRFESRVAWSAVQDSDPAHRWFRQHLLAALIDIHGVPRLPGRKQTPT
jgi:DNA-binding transcriptional LysR family regulator